jgi:hypothetical protein
VAEPVLIRLRPGFRARYRPWLSVMESFFHGDPFKQFMEKELLFSLLLF